ncbi:NUDIX domain-containing protein [Vibrio sp. CAIM 722]|uniref:NUDIX domain-containing protein n=1 Tax=Vibrio eleionomae TaxID=2653505 RepID=A0A7X4RWC5_9VIBR|nr:NUDIX domain-containing protein [Vibrio eleionomae]MZI95766.1 NUDIX domain-containing protein [Vibrio eleionomae]
MSQDVVQVIFISESKLLLGFRQNTEVLANYWGLPSGRIERGETPLQAAYREMDEEVSVRVDDLQLLIQMPDPKYPTTHYFYLCHSWSGELKNAEPHLCREIRWFEIDDLPTDCTPITYSILPLLKRYLKGLE